MSAAPPVAVNVTPRGRGDALHAPRGGGAPLFVLPLETRMPFAAFLRALDVSADEAAAEAAPPLEAGELFDASYDGDGVPYVSAQDGSLDADFAPLAADVPRSLPLGDAAFGAPPDAVNLWLGNSRASSSFHFDHYENLYAVVVGEKRFTLLPPCDSRLLRCRRTRVGRFERDGDGAWRVALEEPPRRVSWATVDPHGGDGEGSSAVAPFVEVTVRAGEILYLPALWHHHVRQSGRRVIAVNWWHDMRFDLRYAYFTFVRKLGDDGDASGGDSGDDADNDNDALALT